MADRSQAVRTTDLSAVARSPIAQFFGSLRSALARVIATPEQRAAFESDFMGPGQPLEPIEPAQVPPRRWDYPAAHNLRVLPGAGKIAAFDVLQNLASWDPVRFCIEERKNRIKARKWDIVPMDSGEDATAKYADTMKALRLYWAKPDRQHTFDIWISRVLEDSFILGPAVIYRWPTRDGKGIWAHKVLSAKHWMPYVDAAGDTPQPPAPAYAQIIKGVTYKWATTDELIYAGRNAVNDSVYPASEVEWLLMVINIALRRDTFDLAYYTQGNAPHGFGGVPETWTPQQIKDFNEYFNSILAGDAAARSRIIFIPGGEKVKPWIDREEDKYVKFSEFVFRRACAIFHVSPQAYTGQVNRSTAETADESQTESADEPLMQWIESIITDEIQTRQGYPELTFSFVTDRKRDELKAAQVDEIRIRSGMKSIDEVRAEAGDQEIGIPPFVMTSQGPIYLEGSNPEYRARYAEFFEMLEASQEPKDRAPAPEKPEGVPGIPPEDEIEETLERISGLFTRHQVEEAAPGVKEELARWRKVALRCAKEGRPQRKFRSDLIQADVIAAIAAGLSDLEKGNALNGGMFRRQGPQGSRDRAYP